MRRTHVRRGVGVDPERASLSEIEAVYRAGLPDFRRVARAVLRSEEGARDAVQDGFVRAIRDRRAYRGEGSLEAWIWRCVMNAVRTSARRNRRAGAEAGELRDPAAPPGATRAAGDVRTLVNCLPERQRLILFLRYYADLDYAGIAKALEISTGTVAASLSAAHQSLRRALEEASA
jgi:RNA polymerase sigma factor (sigma-70 family)